MLHAPSQVLVLCAGVLFLGGQAPQAQAQTTPDWAEVYEGPTCTNGVMDEFGDVAEGSKGSFMGGKGNVPSIRNILKNPVYTLSTAEECATRCHRLTYCAAFSFSAKVTTGTRNVGQPACVMHTTLGASKTYPTEDFGFYFRKNCTSAADTVNAEQGTANPHVRTHITPPTLVRTHTHTSPICVHVLPRMSAPPA